MNVFKKIYPDLIAVALFVVIALVYFFTPITQDLVLSGSDNSAAVGCGQERIQYEKETGEFSRWTNSLFCGMPTYQMAPSYNSLTTLSSIKDVYSLWLPDIMMYVFLYLIGFYILMRAFGFKPSLSVLGAVIWAFSSYFFIIIAAGHIWKVMTLAFIPPTIAGMVLCYKGKYLWGGAVTALFVAFQILSNHLQMTYYFLLVILLMVVAFFIDAIKKKQLQQFFKASAILFVAVLIGVAANISNLYHTYQYSKESMRGKCELASKSSQSSSTSGLTPEYITQWSYGIDETWTLLVPNTKGGASIPMATNEKAMQKANPQYQQLYWQIGQYWGEQPGTSGPVYVGAFVAFLFILGLFIVKGPMKWCLLVATIISILLSWGHNFMDLTQFCIDYVPMYNKFRTVASILVIAEFTIPLLAILALAKVIEKPELAKIGSWQMLVSLALTGGIAFLFAIMPTVFFDSFMSMGELNAINNAFGQQGYAQDIINDITNVRKGIFIDDAWRTVGYIVVGVILMVLYSKKKIKAVTMTILITILCIMDMYSVNKRYLNDGNFTEPTQITNSFVKTPTDEYILQDTDKYYRVLNFATNTFNENETSYWHKSIGGYHAAKLGRYQDMINHCISPEKQATMQAVTKAGGNMQEINGDSIMPILNMLNTKYFILPLQNHETMPLKNPYAMGNAWFVSNIKYVDGANEEMASLKKLNPRHTAVADNEFKDILKEAKPITEGDTIVLTSYKPNELQYETNSKEGGIAIFSDVYYPGWTATIDGNPLEIGRANYILRAAYIPAGKHNIVMEYRPHSIAVTETIAYTAIVILILAFLIALIIEIKRKKSPNF